MPRAVFSFTNNNPFYYKQSILLSEQSILLQNNQSWSSTIQITLDIYNNIHPEADIVPSSASMRVFRLLRCNNAATCKCLALNRDSGVAYGYHLGTRRVQGWAKPGQRRRKELRLGPKGRLRPVPAEPEGTSLSPFALKGYRLRIPDPDMVIWVLEENSNVSQSLKYVNIML